MRVGITHIDHPAYRIDVGQRGITFVERPRPRGRRRWPWTDAFQPFDGRNLDLVHASNSIPIPALSPYVISFEDYLPRVPDDRYHPLLERFLIQRLKSQKCRALLPWSTYAKRQSMEQLRRWGAEQIAEKMVVVPPPTQLRADRPKRARQGRMRLVFVGGDWIRKGCHSLLRAHARLLKAGFPVETTVVSSLSASPRNYVGCPSSAWESSQRKLLDQPGVTHIQRLANEDALHLIADADYLVAPTLHDTYGFASAEAMGCGTPVIATNTCAQPDIVTDGRTGFLLSLESDHLGRWPWVYRRDHPGYAAAFEETVASLADALVETITRAFHQPSADYEAMSEAAIEDVRARLSFESVRVRLEQIYAAAVAH